MHSGEAKVKMQVYGSKTHPQSQQPFLKNCKLKRQMLTGNIEMRVISDVARSGAA